MRSIETTREALLEIHLSEMAFQRKEIVRLVEELTGKITEHVMKVLLYPDDIAVHHWHSEINSWILSIQSAVYNRSKRLDASQYFHLLWEKPFENVDRVEMSISRFHRTLKYPLVKMTPYEIRSMNTKIRKIYEKICADIADDNYVTSKDYL